MGKIKEKITKISYPLVVTKDGKILIDLTFLEDIKWKSVCIDITESVLGLGLNKR